MEYTIEYKTNNIYMQDVHGAHWQFLIVPENNESQHLEEATFINSLNIPVQQSMNGYGFKTYRVAPKNVFKKVDFEAKFLVFKEILNPFQQVNFRDNNADFNLINTIEFKAGHERFLKTTQNTTLSKDQKIPFNFDKSLSLFENLEALNNWIFKSFTFKPQVTQINTDLSEIIEHKHGVCQDFTHLFCALARLNGIPTRYVSGYLHQGIGYLGDSQMHAWAESFVPGTGWIGFDPTNNLLAAENHIKVAHGKDYTDCPPIKGVVYTKGGNTTTYSVKVTSIKNSMGQSQGDGNMQQQMGDSFQKMEFKDLFANNNPTNQ
ncbi:MAG: transglutaminase family protein [Leeuwenhoekiella sp.]